MKLLTLLALALPAFSQTFNSYVASTGNSSLSSAATAATLQQPDTSSTIGSSHTVSFPQNGQVGATVYCSAACVVTLKRNGTAATATAGTVTGVTGREPTALVKFFTGSDVGAGTTVNVTNVSAGQTYPFDLSAFTMGTSGNTTNVTLAIASVTATVNITFFLREQGQQ